MFTRTGYEQSQWNIPLTPSQGGFFALCSKNVIQSVAKDLGNTYLMLPRFFLLSVV